MSKGVSDLAENVARVPRPSNKDLHVSSGSSISFVLMAIASELSTSAAIVMAAARWFFSSNSSFIILDNPSRSGALRSNCFRDLMLNGFEGI